MVYYFVLLLIVASLSLSPTPCGSVEYYVTPTSPPNTDCPQPCYTLDYYALNTTLLSNKENVSLLFLEGLHTLNQGLAISGTRQIHLTQFHIRSEVIVKCNNNIRFEDITYLEIRNLTMYGRDKGGHLKTWLRYKSRTAMLQHLTIERLDMDISGNSYLNHFKLTNSTLGICSWYTPNITTSLTLYVSKLINSRIVGGRFCKDLKLMIIGCTVDIYYDRGLFFYQGTIVFDIGPSGNLHVEIVQTWINGELVLTGRQENNNISLYVDRSEIKNSYFYHNSVKVYLSKNARNNNFHIQITNSKISDTNHYGLSIEIEATRESTMNIYISNTSFSNHRHQGAMQVRNNLFSVQDKTSLDSETMVNIVIENCTFKNNKQAVLLEIESTIRSRLEMVITNSTFYGNENAIDLRRNSLKKLTTRTTIESHLFASLRKVTLENNSPLLFKSGVVHIVDVDMLNIQDCRFINNQGKYQCNKY